MEIRAAGASQYDRLERAIIALQYALADARSEADDALGATEIGVSRAQDALQQAGEEVQKVLTALRAQALHSAAASAREWSDTPYPEGTGVQRESL
jgi:signal transduction histidine kinase